MRRLLMFLFALLMLAPVRADALSVRDVVELARAGLGDDILLALIEVDRTVFPIDAETLKTLKAAGVGERVIVAMIRSQRTRPPEPAAPVDVTEETQAAQLPPVIVIDHHDEVRIREVLVPVPVYAPVLRRQRFRPDVDGAAQRSGLQEPPHQTKKPAEPIYWGWNGKLRPDAWQPE